MFQKNGHHRQLSVQAPTKNRVPEIRQAIDSMTKLHTEFGTWCALSLRDHSTSVPTVPTVLAINVAHCLI